MLGGRKERKQVPKLSEIDAPGKPEEMYRDENGAICYNQQREVHQWAEREIKLQPVLNKNLPTTQSLSCRGLVTVMAKIGIAPIPKT